MTCHYLLVITALRAGEGSDLPRAEGRDDCCLVPLEDVGALFAPLPKGHNRAPLVDYQASLHLYCHVSYPSRNSRWISAIRGSDCTRIFGCSRQLGSTSPAVVPIEGQRPSYEVRDAWQDPECR